MAWWDRKKPGETCQVVVVQVDLGGHTVWASGQDSAVSAYERRERFATELEERLKERQTDFDLLHWLGDGGVFVREFRSSADAERVCTLADTAFDLFSSHFAADRELSLRVSATLLTGVFIGANPGHWFSAELNAFLKYERQIGRANAFVVTDVLRRNMHEGNACFERLAVRRRVRLPGDVSILVHDDVTRSVEARESPRRFSRWLNSRRTEMPRPSKRFARFEPSRVVDYWVVGDTAILGTALGPRGYDQIEFEQSTNVDPLISKPFGPAADLWEAKRAAIASLTGTKAFIRHVVHPATDDETLRLAWQLADYPVVRSFHELVEKSEDAWRAYELSALEMRPRLLPGILGTHCALITTEDDGSRRLLLAHRRKGDRPGGYLENCWSASFEEQYIPVAGSWGGRWHDRDRDLASTVIRGAKEEFLGEDYAGTLSVRLHALHLELMYLNVGLLAVVELPDTDFDSVARSWPGAVDGQEHDALLSIALNGAVLTQCLQSDRVPKEIVATCPKAGRESWGNEDDRWHPTSRARMAMCLWLLETGGLDTN